MHIHKPNHQISSNHIQIAHLNHRRLDRKPTVRPRVPVADYHSGRSFDEEEREQERGDGCWEVHYFFYLFVLLAIHLG